jgi:hypothetical protein
VRVIWPNLVPLKWNSSRALSFLKDYFAASNACTCHMDCLRQARNENRSSTRHAAIIVEIEKLHYYNFHWVINLHKKLFMKIVQKSTCLRN